MNANYDNPYPQEQHQHQHHQQQQHQQQQQQQQQQHQHSTTFFNNYNDYGVYQDYCAPYGYADQTRCYGYPQSGESAFFHQELQPLTTGNLNFQATSRSPQSFYSGKHPQQRSHFLGMFSDPPVEGADYRPLSGNYCNFNEQSDAGSDSTFMASNILRDLRENSEAMEFRSGGSYYWGNNYQFAFQSNDASKVEESFCTDKQLTLLMPMGSKTVSNHIAKTTPAISGEGKTSEFDKLRQPETAETKVQQQQQQQQQQLKQLNEITNVDKSKNLAGSAASVVQACGYNFAATNSGGLTPRAPVAPPTQDLPPNDGVIFYPTAVYPSAYPVDPLVGSCHAHFQHPQQAQAPYDHANFGFGGAYANTTGGHYDYPRLGYDFYSPQSYPHHPHHHRPFYQNPNDDAMTDGSKSDVSGMYDEDNGSGDEMFACGENLRLPGKRSMHSNSPHGQRIYPWMRKAHLGHG